MIRAVAEAKRCQFGRSVFESREIAVIDKVLMLAPPELRKKILEAGHVDIDRMTKIVKTYYTIQSQTQTLNASNQLVA